MFLLLCAARFSSSLRPSLFHAHTPLVGRPGLPPRPPSPLFGVAPRASLFWVEQSPSRLALGPRSGGGPCPLLNLSRGLGAAAVASQVRRCYFRPAVAAVTPPAEPQHSSLLTQLPNGAVTFI
jgi:hypothetical protein